MEKKDFETILALAPASPGRRRSPRHFGFSLFFLAALTGGISMAAQLPGISDTEPVTIDWSGEDPTSPLVELSMLLDYGALPSMKYFAARKPSKNVELLWDGAAKLLVEQRTEGNALTQLREMSTVMLERYIAMYPRDTQALMVYGVRLYQTNQVEQSLLVFERATKIDPDQEQIAELFSGILVRSGNFKRAMTRIRTLLDWMPDNRVIRFNAACAYALGDNKQDAVYQLKVLAQTGWPELAYYMGDADLVNARSTKEFRVVHDLLLQEARSKLNQLLLSSIQTPSL